MATAGIDRRGTSEHRPVGRRAARYVACGTAAALAITAGVTAGGGGASAADLQAQSVGRFLDGSAGGNPIQTLVDLKDARATAPGTQSQQNPLDATVGGQLDVPLSNALKLPGNGVFKLGAANQVAVAQYDGYSYGASGAIANSGGASVGGDDSAYPSNASITLSDASIGSLPIPSLPDLPSAPGSPTLPGLPTLPALPAAGKLPAAASAPTLPALGSVTADIGAVAALAKTNTNSDLVSPTYQIGSLDLVIGSPALKALLGQLSAGGAQLTTLLGQASAKLSALPAGTPLGSSKCALTSGTVPSTPLSLDGGAVVLDPSTAQITVHLATLLKQLGLDLNSLPPNTDVLAYVLNSLSKILSTGLENVVNGITEPLQSFGSGCLDQLPDPVKTLIGTTLFGGLTTGQTQLETAINSIAAELGSAGSSGLGALTDGLRSLVSIGANVQQGGYPLSDAATPKYAFDSSLKATADQADSRVDGQGVVRALEIDLLNAGGGAQAVLALGNAAAGPGAAAPAAVAGVSAQASNGVEGVSAAASAVPTAIPAGQAKLDNGTPVLPLVLVLVGLVIAGGGVLRYRLRARPTH